MQDKQKTDRKIAVLLNKIAIFLELSQKDKYSGTVNIGVAMKQGGIMGATLTPQYHMDLKEE